MIHDNIWYHVYPLGFLGAEQERLTPEEGGGAGQHRWRTMVRWLDPLVDLGCGGVLIGPLGESQTHGYDVVDPFQLDRRLGDETDFLHWMKECRRRSLSVAIDVVFHHVGRAHPHFLNVLDQGRASPWRDWFLLNFERPGYDGFSYETFEGHGELVKLNHANPQVLDWAVDVARCWMRRGVDGFRLDAAYAIPTTFLAGFADRVRQENPDVLLLGEMIHGDYISFVESSNLDTVTQYELWKAVWSSLNDGNFFELAHALRRHGEFSERFPTWNFLGNHDTTRIATRLSDHRHLPHAIATLMTIPGYSAIYAGDEQGAEGTKYDRPGGDDEIRRPPPLGPESLVQEAPPLWRLHGELIAIRRERPWLASGKISIHQLTNRMISYEVAADGQRLLVVLSTEEAPLPCQIPEGMTCLAGNASGHSNYGPLPPHGWGIWE